MSTLFTMACLVATLALGATPAPAAPQAPTKPGVYAATDRGIIELTAFGERQQVDVGIEQYYYSPSALEQIPTVTTIQSFYVNMEGWTPYDLYIVAGKERLKTPRDKYERLNGRGLKRGPVAFEVVTEELQSSALEKAYRKLLGKKRRDPVPEAFVVVEFVSQSGVATRSYPLRVTMPEPEVK